MPPQNSKKSVNNGVSSGLPPFVSCELSDEQKKFVKAHLPTIQESMDCVDGWVRDGFKLSLRYDDKSNAVQATLTGPISDHVCSGKALSARGPSVVAALGVLVYKHVEVLKENWAESLVSGGKRDPWA